MKEAPKGIEPKRNENEARKEAEGEGPDKMTHVQASEVHREHSHEGVQRPEKGLKSVPEARQPISNSLSLVTQ